jgi:preprotein translocase subunit SecY
LQAYIASLFAQGQPLFILFNGLLIGFFCFFYAPISFNCEETADQLKKNGVFISGLRPGQKTTQYLLAILYRVTCLGAIYLMTLCVIPEIFGGKSSLAFGGTSLLILVGTTIDLLSQVKVFSHQERKDLSGKLQACIRLWSPRLSS